MMTGRGVERAAHAKALSMKERGSFKEGSEAQCGQNTERVKANIKAEK